MTFITSTIPAFRAALIAGMQARPTLKSVPITDGVPRPDVLEGEEFIALHNVTFETKIRALNRASQPRNEEYRQHLVIMVVYGEDDDNVAVGNRAFALKAEVEQLLREDPPLAAFYTGAGQIVAAVMGQGEYLPQANDQQRAAQLTFDIRVEARL